MITTTSKGGPRAVTCGRRIARRRVLTTSVLCVAAAACSIAFDARAEEWPSKPVRIVVPFAPGSAGDIWGRLLAARLEPVWKQPVIIENKPGASGLIGAEAVAKARPDGYTLLQLSQTFMFAKYTVKDLRFDPETALLPIYKFVNYKMVYATNAQTKAASMAELVELSKASPKGLFFAGLGPTASHDVVNNIVGRQLGIQYSAVPYPGVAQATLALVKDEVQFAMNTPSAYKGHFESGTLRPLAAIAEERYRELPSVPTVRELGYKGILPQLWSGIFAPKGTPQEVIDRIARDIGALVADPAFREELEAKSGGTLLQSSPAAFGREQVAEFKLWADYFAAAGIKPE